MKTVVITVLLAACAAPRPMLPPPKAPPIPPVAEASAPLLSAPPPAATPPAAPPPAATPPAPAWAPTANPPMPQGSRSPTSLACDNPPGEPVRSADGVTGTVSCGQTVIGHTAGGVAKFNTAFYEKKHCWPGVINKDGGDERIYRLTLPRDRMRATVTLTTPCADLDVMAFPWNGAELPGITGNVLRCEQVRKEGRQAETIDLVSQRQDTWYIVVEGKDADEGAFSLSVACGEWY